MKLVMTLMVRNEADIIDSQIAFHLAAGVDFVIAMDHGSTDETTEILERYERSGVLHLLQRLEPDEAEVGPLHAHGAHGRDRVRC